MLKLTEFKIVEMTISYGKFGGNNMKILGSFVDCVYESHLYFMSHIYIKRILEILEQNL